MNYKYLYQLLMILLFVLSCQEDVPLADLEDDFNDYIPRPRIEAIIYPADNASLVRLDQSFQITDTTLFNCKDEDDTWGFYICNNDNTDWYIDKESCLDVCGSDDCSNHPYLCNCQSECDFHAQTFATQKECVDVCSVIDDEGKLESACLTDDVGTDGRGGDPFDEDEDGITEEKSEGEGNNQPDCNEPNVDNQEEYLSQVHTDDCDVYITHGLDNQDTVYYHYFEDGGSFVDNSFGGFNFDDTCDCEESSEYEDISESIKPEIEIEYYGSYRPVSSLGSNDRISFPINYDDTYTFHCDCSNSADTNYVNLGLIKSFPEQIPKKPYFFMPIAQEELKQCVQDNSDAYGCLQDFAVDSVIFSLDLLKSELVFDEYGDIIVDSTIFKYKNWDDRSQACSAFDDGAETNLTLGYASLASFYQLTQYQVLTTDENGNDSLYYIHGHQAEPIDSIAALDDILYIGAESIIPLPNQDNRYVVFNFSSGYQDYYQFSALELDDPVRTNLRDQGGQGLPIMGAFGAIPKNSVYFKLTTNPCDPDFWRCNPYFLYEELFKDDCESE